MMARRIALLLTAETADVNGTQEVTIRLNEQVVVCYMPGTKHAKSAIEDAEQTVGDVLSRLFKEVGIR
jgi:hypothetical protein